MPDVVLPVLDEREALPWVLERMPAGYRADRRRQRLDRRVGRRSPRALGARVVREPRAAASAPPASPACAAARGDVVCFMDCDASLRPAASCRASPTPSPRGARRPRARRPPAARRGAWPLHARLANRALASSCAAARACR